jgi:hypothetical protein
MWSQRKKPSPTVLLGLYRQRDERPWIGELVERRHVEPVEAPDPKSRFDSGSVVRLSAFRQARCER